MLNTHGNIDITWSILYEGNGLENHLTENTSSTFREIWCGEISWTPSKT